MEREEGGCDLPITDDDLGPAVIGTMAQMTESDALLL